MVFISFLIVYSENGLTDLLALCKEEQIIMDKNKKIEKENTELARKVTRLKHDMGYIEHVARHELGMAAQDELIFKIKKP